MSHSLPGLGNHTIVGGQVNLLLEVCSPLEFVPIRTKCLAANMSPAEDKLFRRSEEAKLQRMWGDKMPHKVVQAQELVRRLERENPGLVETSSGFAPATIPWL